MILVDTGPLVAAFDPRDAEHARCRELFAKVDDELVTTVPVLTEASYMLRRTSRGFRLLNDMRRKGGFSVFFLNELRLARAFELIEEYSDQRMDLSDASLVVSAESLETARILTLDRKDFSVFRIRRGHRLERFEIVS